MIEHMLNQVKQTGLQNIYVATDSHLIEDIVIKNGCKAIMTDENCPSGTDRVFSAVQLMQDSDHIEYIINVQGDMPFLEPNVILKLIENLKTSSFGIMTPVVKVDRQVADSNANVKVVANKDGKALYFSRSMVPFGSSEFLYHIGVYGFQKNTLTKFVELPQSFLEKQENLEQLRALENNIDIGIVFVDSVPISIDTESDLEKAIEFYNSNYKN